MSERAVGGTCACWGGWGITILLCPGGKALGGLGLVGFGLSCSQFIGAAYLMISQSDIEKNWKRKDCIGLQGMCG